MKIIDALKPHGRVFITSEQGDKELDHYRVGIPQGQIHSLLYYSSLYAGDSQTMAGEAAVLGVPSVRCSSWVGKLPTLEELEKRYGLTYGFSIDQQEQALNKIRELVNQPDAKRLWQARRERMLRDKIDLADYYMRLIESKSAKLPSLG